MSELSLGKGSRCRAGREGRKGVLGGDGAYAKVQRQEAARSVIGVEQCVG